MGPLSWSALALLVVMFSAVVVVASIRLWNRCRHAGSTSHAAEVTEKVTPQLSKRPIVIFRWAFAITFGYWAAMLAFYLVSLGSTQSLRAFFAVVGVTTLPAVVLSLVFSFWFLKAGGDVIDHSTMRGPAVTAIQTRASILAAGWLGVALFSVLFALAARQRGF